MLAVPLPLNKRALPLRLASFKSSVLATSEPTLTCAPWPNRMPLGLIKYTCPLALRCPRIWLPLVSTMRFTAIALAEGCTKFTVSCLAMLKLCQLSDRFWLDCVMVVVWADCTILPAPETTCPPTGAACAKLAVSDRAAATSLRLEPLPRPRADSATATQAFETWFQTMR